MLVGKRQVELGRVRVRTRVVWEQVSEEVSLRAEQVNVQRHQREEPISADQADALLKDSTIELAETGEEAVVAKQAVITGEVVVGKDGDTRTEHVDGTVRHTEVEVDRVASTDR